MKRILLAGETFTLVQTAVSGATTGHSSRYVNGAAPFLAALDGSGILVEQLPSERCEAEFPSSMPALQPYSAIILSDISALTLLLTPSARTGETGVNRLSLLVDYVRQGGSLMMAGGYTSFQGMDGLARYHGTPLEECLPVSCLPYSDGLEAPEGLAPVVIEPNHPIVARMPENWLPILGLNKVIFRPESQSKLVVEVRYRGQSHPLLAIRNFGEGRTLAFMTDIGPHWMSRQFMESPDYQHLMRKMAQWLCREI